MNDLVTVIIPTYNRFSYLLNAIASVKAQTYPNIELIIVNDRSTETEYYNYEFKDCIVIHMEINSKKRFGKASPGGFQRSVGMKIANGNYIAFLDDDDVWFPEKIEKQLLKMKLTQCGMSCTDGLFGVGVYNKDKQYVIYNEVKFKNIIKQIFNRKKKGSLMKNGFPDIWNEEFMNVHNCCIASSIMIEKKIIDKVGYFSNKHYAPDYDYWIRSIKHTDCVFVREPLMYYDAGHGNGQLY